MESFLQRLLTPRKNAEQEDLKDVLQELREIRALLASPAGQALQQQTPPATPRRRDADAQPVRNAQYLPTPDSPPRNRVRPAVDIDDLVRSIPALRLNQEVEDVPRRRPLPDVCEVSRRDLQDPQLEDDYPGLPKLRAGRFGNYRYGKTHRATGGFPYSDWEDNENLYKLLLPAIKFVTSGRYVNPSRVDPARLSARSAWSSTERYELQIDVGGTEPEDAICISPIRTTHSSVRTATRCEDSPGAAASSENKSISGKLHTQEWERMMATICMAFDKTILQAHLKNGTSLSFYTSPKEAWYEIPVYDATGLSPESLPMMESFFDNLRGSTLPRWNKEIPKGSCALVAYAPSSFHMERNDSWMLYTNIKWIIILHRAANE